MQENDELRAKAKSMASASQNPNPEIPDKLPTVREEGELTSSDDDALPASSVVPSAAVSASPSSCTPNASTKTCVQGNLVSANLRVGSSDIQSQIPSYHKSFNKNQASLNLNNPGWHAPSANSNLVISFSDDDDSGGDGEERRQEKAMAIDRHRQVVNSTQKPPSLPQTARRTARNERKTVPKKASLSRMFSSATKIHGSGVRSGGSSLAAQRSWLNKSDLGGKIIASQDPECRKNMDLSNSKLQDLRQQIAMRENALKRKVLQKNKENVSDTCKDVNAMGQNKVSSSKFGVMSATGQTEPKEPNRKRLKTVLNSPAQPSSSGLHEKPVAKSMMTLKESLLKNSSSQDGNGADHGHHESEPSQRELLPRSPGMQIQDRKQLPHPSENQRSRVMQDATGVAGNCSLSDWIYRPGETLAMTKQAALLKNATSEDHLDKSMSKHPGVMNKNQPSSSAPQDMQENDMNKVKDHHGAVYAREKRKSTSCTNLQASPDNTGLLHSLGRSAVFGCGDEDLHSLFEIEELHDKELEEAQELRRRCEVEEINALKAYRRAQRALAEANARCSYLYRRRELYSAQLRSFVMEDPSLLWSTRQHREMGDAWNFSNKTCEANLGLLPKSSHQLQAEFDGCDQLGYDPHAQSADGDGQNRFSAIQDGHNLGSEGCSEPDASTSELLVLRNTSGNGIYSLSPEDEDDASPRDNRYVHANVTCPSKEDNPREREKNMGIDSITNFSADGSQDPLVLEAYLRSKLVSRLAAVSSSKQSHFVDNGESIAERVSEENATGTKTQMIVDSVPLSDPKVSSPDCGGAKEPEGSLDKLPFNVQNQQNVEEHSLKDSRIASFDPEDSSFHFIDIASTSIISSSSIFRSSMKAACPLSLDSLQTTEQHYGSPDTCNEDDLVVRCEQDKPSLDIVNCAEEVLKHVSFGRIDSYTCKCAINPFWPLCMYELRGRCNNDECPWQHVKDHSSSNVNQRDCSDVAGMNNLLVDFAPSSCLKVTGTLCADHQTEYSFSSGCVEISNLLTPPRYLVCLDSLRADSRMCSSLQPPYFASSRKNIFSYSLAISSLFLKHLPSDEPYLHGNDGSIESYGCSGHSLCFRSRNGAGNPILNGLADNDQFLETALLIFSQEVNKLEGMKKSLSILSRGLEADPVSLHLWIIYLFLYYSSMNSVEELHPKGSVGKDDFFSYAVKHNERSYELWLLYINSRRQLNDRVAAYQRALTSLCHHASAESDHPVHTSAAILDLFLQMLYLLCMSGNVAKAVQRIYRLVHSDESHSLLLSNILHCLTISDKCIFWVCCLYLVIYRKLPDAFVQQFEFEKGIPTIEWPSAHLSQEEKQRVSKLMNVAIDSVGLIDGKAALNYVKLMAAIDDKESYRTFLKKCRSTYPTCLELTLLSARGRGYTAGSGNFEGFGEALSCWPKEVPGIQCIWNQFAENALQNGRPDRAKDIMDKWFHSVLKPHFFNNQSNAVSEDPLSGSNLNSLLSNSNKMDIVFGLLNLSLYRLFQNDAPGAYLAVDKALRVADPEVLRHCIMEHAVFLLKNGSQLKKDVSVRGLLDILKGYVIHEQAIPAAIPLTRKFIRDIQKPRLKQLVSNILSPISPNSSLVNLVLDVWFGSSLLPSKSLELKDMVDFVEAVLEVSPANYQLVISACKTLSNDSNASNTKPASVLFWASSVLVNTIYHAIPVPPEYVWVEAADLLGKLINVQEILESFHRRGLSVYPFSVKLWKSFLNVSKAPSKRSSVMEAARERGIQL